jgi:hypothetical protein
VAKGKPADGHGYLTSRRIPPGDLRMLDGRLLVPFRTLDGELATLQTIDAAGLKMNLKGSHFGDSLHVIGEPSGNGDSRWLLAEGLGTAHALSRADDAARVAVVGGAARFKTVAKAIHTRWPNTVVTICADVGMEDTARKAAEAVGGGVLEWPAGLPANYDAFDFEVQHGAEALADLLRTRTRATAKAAEAGPRDKFDVPRVEPQPKGAVWPNPRPLPEATLAPVAPFDMALLPESLRPWAADIAERMQCSPDYVGATVVAALGVVIGRRVGIRPKRRDDWTEYGNQWCCVIGRPGTLKSPAMNEALKPLHWLDVRFGERYQEELAAYEARVAILRIRRDAEKKRVLGLLKRDPNAEVDTRAFVDEEPPPMRRVLVHDVTVEQLQVILSQNPDGVGVVRDELVSLFRSLEREGQESSRGFYLTGWSGNLGYSVDRIGRGRVHIPAVCLSLIGSTQPGRIAEYLLDATTGGAGDDGLMQRFGLLIWPDLPREPWQNIDTEPDAAVRHQAYAVFDRLMTASPVHDWCAQYPVNHAGEPDEMQPPFLRLDEDANELFVKWRAKLEHEVREASMPEALESHLAKFRKLVPGLALLFHLADGGRGPVNAATMERAIRWAHYLRTHAQRAYGMCLITPVDRARALLRKIAEQRLPAEPFALKRIYDAGWSRLGTKEEAQEAVDVLLDYGYLVVADVGGKSETGGRPKEPRYVVNPKAMN